MPYPAHALANFKREYGNKEGVRRFFAWKGAHPRQFKRALSTAQREGGAHVAAHSATRPHGRSLVVRRLQAKR